MYIANLPCSVAGGISDVSKSISQFDNLTADIAQDMKKVNDASLEMSEKCGTIKSDAEKMNVQTDILDDLINKFVIE